MRHLLHGVLRDHERSAIAAFDFPCAISSSVWRSRGVSSRERRLVGTRPRGDERLDDLGSTPSRRLRPPGSRYELLEVAHALLEEVPASGRSAFEERKGIQRIEELAQHDHADLRVRVAEASSAIGCPRRFRSAAS